MLNEKILEFKENCELNNVNIDDLVKECFNCEESRVDEKGDIRIAIPQTGHWLNENEKVEFIEWVESR